jgi:DnaJ-domain-containing protein 1
MKKRNLSILGCLVWVLLLTIQIATARILDPARSHSALSPDGRYLVRVFSTEEKTWVRILETPEMISVAEWQIPAFQPQTIAFSPQDSSRLLLADKQRVLVYRLLNNDPQLQFAQPENRHQELVQAAFTEESSEAIVWATPTRLVKTDPDSRQETRLISIHADGGSIRGFTPLPDDRYAVFFNNDNRILLYSGLTPTTPRELKGHRAPVSGAVRSADGRWLFSVDQNQELLVWNLTSNQVQHRLQLGDIERPARVRGIGQDAAKTSLLVKTELDPGESGSHYALDDLRKGIVKPQPYAVSMSAAGVLYPSAPMLLTEVEVGIEHSEDRRQIDRRVYVSSVDERSSSETGDRKSTVKKPSFYELAKIEADNDNFDAALDFIKQIPLDDPNFKASRELRKAISDQIALKRSLNSAIEQYRIGNYPSARILLQSILAKYPEQPTAKRYLKLVDQSTRTGPGVFWMLFIMMILVLAGVSIYAWYYRPALFRRFSGILNRSKTAPRQPSADFSLRKSFILQLDQTRKVLRKAISIDKEGKWNDRWLEITSIINDIEFQAKKDDKRLKKLMKKLDHQLARILKLVPSARQAPQQKETGPGDGNENQTEGPAKEERDRSRRTQPPDPPPSKATLNYYQVLGVDEKATNEEIKQAYRQKMRDYHPDKHNASDFEWVKSESDRMTRLVREAYDVLIDPEKRKRYVP